MDEKLDQWFADLSEEQKSLATTFRHIIHTHAPNATEALKWGMPCYSGRGMVCYIQKAKTHMSLGFAQGTNLPDPGNLLTGSGDKMRHVKIKLGEQPVEAALAPLIKAAWALDQQS